MLGVPPQVILAAAMIVASIPMLGWSLAGVRHRVRSGTTSLAGTDGRQERLRVSALDRVVVPLARAVGKRARAVTPSGWVTSLDRLIQLAGSPDGWTVERALALKLALGAAGALSTVVLTGESLTAELLGMSALAGMVGYMLPDILLRAKARDRQKLVLRELPDTLDQLTISVEAGLGFDAALARVAATGDGPLAEELTRTLAEIKVGVPRSDSLRRLIDRTDVHELRHFVLALVQAEQYGLPVARVLRIQSAELRLKRRQRAEETAMKVPVKIVFPLVLCIFPALFVVLLGPAMIRVARVLL